MSNTEKMILNLALNTIDACIDIAVKCPDKNTTIKLLKKLKETVQKNNTKRRKDENT